MILHGNPPQVTVLLLLVFALAGRAAVGETFYVSPQGNDGWSGRLASPNEAGTDGPLASLNAARDAVRTLKDEKQLTEPTTIVIADGEYDLREPLTLQPQDGGMEGAPIVYTAAPGAEPVFNAGRRIGGFEEVGDGVWATEIEDVAAGDWYFEQLWVNGRRASRARSPNKFYYYAVSGAQHGVDPATGELANLSNRALIARRQDIEPLLDIPPERMNDVTMVAYHSWAASRHRLAGIDPERNMVVATGNAPWPMDRWHGRQRYHLENFKAALDQPGEWFLDRDGTLYYMPLPDEDMRDAEVIAPVCEQFVTIAGDAKLGLTVDHVTIRGLHFRHGQYILPPEGHADGQAADSIRGMILVDGASNITIEDCEVAHIGTYGIWFREGCQSCRVERCYIHDMGAGGIRFGVGWGYDLGDPATHTGHCVADNNIIHAGGRLYPGCCGVWIGHSGHNELTHNDISDLYYTGISVGWNWGYSYSPAVDNTIEFNHVHHIGQGVMSDMGGIYTLGISPETVIKNNVFHDIYSYDRYGRGGWGLYNDQASTGIVMENNLVYNTKTGGYHLHFGRDLTIRNNIFANSMDGQLQRSRIEDHHQFDFVGNIVYWDGGELFHGGWEEPGITMRNNLYWDASGEPIDFRGMGLDQWRREHEPGATVADPLFVDPQTGDFRLKDDSPAFDMGFEEFDYRRAGVYGDAEWKALAESFEFEPVEFAPEAPPPPPVQIHDDFELTPVGGSPAMARVYEGGGSAYIRVTDQVAAGGDHALAIQDGPDLQHAYNPHLYYQPRHDGGVSRVSFDIRIAPDVIMYVEWRDNHSPYRVGPSVWVRHGQLVLGGEAVLDLPVDEWIHFEIAAGLGDQATQTWKLEVALPGGEVEAWDDLPVGNEDWRKLDWVGFSSTAENDSLWYLDNIKLTNSPAEQ